MIASKRDEHEDNHGSDMIDDNGLSNIILRKLDTVQNTS
jgi:hypothetical protein